jgi:uncharacterized oligopeptide transporter (OPT) family protein
VSASLPLGGGYREVTVLAVVLGVLIGVVMNASITYAGLKIGFTIGGSAIAAVLGFGVLKLLRRGTIVETNIVQTVASAVNTSNSGVIFTVPVLILLGFSLSWSDANFWLLTMASIAGAIMGTVFIIPLRKQMIDIDRLRFPSATGVATILKSPGAGVQKFMVLMAGIVVGAAIYLPAALPEITRPAEIAAATAGEPSPLEVLIERGRVSPAQAERTREMAAWIESQRAPEELVARGRALAEKDALERELSTLADATRREELLARLGEFEATIAQSPGRGHSDELCVQLYRVTAGVPAAEGGAAPGWESIRSTQLGWAADPMPGYQDLNYRLPAYYDAEGKLVELVDQNRDGRPDLAMTDKAIDVGRILGIPGELALVFAITPLSLGAGYITGRPGLMVLVGGILAYVIVNPITYNLGWLPPDVTPGTLAGWARNVIGKPLGIGMLLGGALMGVVAAAPAIFAAFKSIAGAGVGPGSKHGRDEMSLTPLVLIAIGGLAMLFLAADLMTSRPINSYCPVTEPSRTVEVSQEVEPVEVDGQLVGFASEEAKAIWLNTWTDEQRAEVAKSLGMKRGLLAGLPHHVRAAIIAAVGALWIWFAGVIIAQCTGMTDWSPISGLALVTVVLVMLLAGTGQVLASVLLGVALCTAITLAADMMGDLKTGYLVGSKPIRQQAIEICVVGIGPAVSMMTVLLIAQTKELGSIEVPAAQADALRSVILGVQGGELPYALYAMGGLMGILLGIGGFAGLGVLVGLSVYLPFIYIATYGVGCVLSMFTTMAKGRRWTEEWGVPFAAGLIVGEAVPALLVNIVILSNG